MSILKRFFRIFAILARFWEGLGLQKIEKNRKKTRSGRVWNSFEIESDFGSDFQRVLDGFFKILDGFGKDFMAAFACGRACGGPISYHLNFCL